MGWTKREGAVLAHKNRLSEIRAELRSLSGELSSRKQYYKAVQLLREHEGLCAALSYGKRDGTVKREINVSIGYKHYDMSPVLTELLSEGSDSYTFRRNT